MRVYNIGLALRKIRKRLHILHDALALIRWDARMRDFEMSLYLTRNRCILTPLTDNDTIFGIMPEQVLKLLH